MEPAVVLILTWLRQPGNLKWLIGAGVLVQVLVCLLSGQWKTTEYWEYGQIARQIIDGNGYRFPFTDEALHFQPADSYPSALMPPAYVFFLLPFLLIPPPFANLLLFGFQVVISASASVLFYDYVRRKAGTTLAAAAILFQFLSPDLLYVPSAVGPGAWFQLLVVLLLRSHDRGKGWRGSLLPGMAGGLLVLFRSEALAFLGILAWIQFRSGRKPESVAFLASASLVLLPWLIRNQQVLGSPVLSNNAGVNFYRGHNPGEPGDWPPVWDKTYLLLRCDPPTFERRYDQHAMDLALDWIVQNPGAECRQIPKKIVWFWLGDPRDPRTAGWIYRLSWWPLFLAGMAGLVPAWRMGFRAECGLFALYTLLALVFFPQVRYLSLVKFFWMVPAAAGTGLLLRRWGLLQPGKEAPSPS